MIVYNYSPDTGEFLFESPSRKDQVASKKSGVFVPANPPRFATKIAPPQAGENQKACFNESTQQWEIKADFRGKTYYDKETRQPVIIDFLGDIPENLQETQSDPPPPTEEELLIQAVESVKSKAVEEFGKASVSVKSKFFSQLQWIQAQPINQELIINAQEVITKAYIADNDPDKEEAEALRSELLQILKGENNV